MDSSDYQFMRRAIDEARKSLPEDHRLHPMVGVVVAKDGTILATAFRGELQSTHAEQFALEGKLKSETLAGATVYTTLEPCTTRRHPKIPCVRRLIERRIARVVIGMRDPDPAIVGRGHRLLQEADITTDFFPDELKAEIEELNRDYIRSFNEPRYFPGILRPLGMKGLSSRATYLPRFYAQLARRWWVTWLSSTKRDFVFDGLRLLAFFLMFWGIGESFSFRPVNFILSLAGNYSLEVDYRFLIATSGFVLFLHTFVYSFLRQPSKWDIEFRKRKLNMTTSLLNATACVQESVTLNRLKNIEWNALSAIKSFVEFTVSDHDGNNFCANLLVRHPNADDELVCISRTDPSRGVNIPYQKADMRRVRRTMETGDVYYDGNYYREGKPYNMVWHIPIPSSRPRKENCIGLVCVDSRRARHLNLFDERRSLLLNLAPYLSVLGLSLAMRFEYNIWDRLE